MLGHRTADGCPAWVRSAHPTRSFALTLRRPLPILTISRMFIEFLSGAAEYRVGRLAPGSLLGKKPLLVTVRTVEIQFPRKGHSLPHVAPRRQLAENAIAMFRDVV